MNKLPKEKQIEIVKYLTEGMSLRATSRMVEREGEIRAKVVEDAKRNSLIPEVFANVEEGSVIYTDKLTSYNALDDKFIHQSVDHRLAFVDGDIYTNTLENFWSLFKRCVKGTYVSIASFHTDRYLDEETFRWNNRDKSDAARFMIVVSQIFGKRLTYEELIGHRTT